MRDWPDDPGPDPRATKTARKSASWQPIRDRVYRIVGPLTQTWDDIYDGDNPVEREAVTQTYGYAQELKTRSGYKVQLFCDDLNDGPYSILGTYTDNSGDKKQSSWTRTGEFNPAQAEPCRLDLVFSPKKQIVYSNVYKDDNGDLELYGNLFPDANAAILGSNTGCVGLVRIELEQNRYDKDVNALLMSEGGIDRKNRCNSLVLTLNDATLNKTKGISRQCQIFDLFLAETLGLFTR